MCIDNVQICFGIAIGQILSIFDRGLPTTPPFFSFRTKSFVNLNGFSPNLICTLILWRSGLGLLIGKFSQFFTSAFQKYLENLW